MKKFERRFVCIVLAAVLLISGCGTSGNNVSAGGTALNSDSAAESAAAESAAAEESTAEEESAATGESDAVQESEETTGEAKREDAGDFEFNPHLYSPTIAKVRGEEYWEGLYNCVDALRAGKDTFECASAEVYEWCASTIVLYAFFPVGGIYTKEHRADGYFKNGIGKLEYTIPVEEYLEKEEEFEKEICKILNENVEPDYDEVEKCLALYDYVATTCSYEALPHEISAEEMKNLPMGGTYGCVLRHKGMCVDFGVFYSYLLLQCGVDALEIGTYDNICHSWTYVVIDGKGYHVDTTWALKENYDGKLWLDYFMMTDRERADNTGAKPENFSLDHFFSESEILDLSATDKRFVPLHGGKFRKIDREKKIIYYDDGYSTKEFYYGE